MGSKLTLQAARIVISHWNNKTKQKETFDLLERIVKIQSKPDYAPRSFLASALHGC